MLPTHADRGGLASTRVSVYCHFGGTGETPPGAGVGAVNSHSHRFGLHDGQPWLYPMWSSKSLFK